MNELALFAGAGGGILGGNLLGWRTVCAVERDAYAAQVLAQRQNDGILKAFPIWSDVCTFDGNPWRGIVDVVSGGFPCQDISAAGKGAGIGGGRSGLWKEMARIIGEVRPRYVFVENSPMLTSRGLGAVLGDLAALGFDAEWGVLSAADVGAPHLRERIWILAHAEVERCRETRKFRHTEPSERFASGGKEISFSDAISLRRHARRCDDGEHERSIIDAGGQHNGEVPNAVRDRSQREREIGEAARQAGLCSGARSDEEQHLCDTASAGFSQWADEPLGRPEKIAELERPNWWATEPDVGRVANGVAARVDRLKAIGNGQVPRVAEGAFNQLRKRIKA